MGFAFFRYIYTSYNENHHRQEGEEMPIWKKEDITVTVMGTAIWPTYTKGNLRSKLAYKLFRSHFKEGELRNGIYHVTTTMSPLRYKAKFYHEPLF